MSGHRTPELAQIFYAFARFLFFLYVSLVANLQIFGYENSIYMPVSGGSSKLLNNMATDEKSPLRDILQRHIVSEMPFERSFRLIDAENK